MVIMAATRAIPRAGVALAMEGDRWIVTVGGYGDSPPSDYEGFVSYTKTLPAPDIHELVSSAEPVEEGATTARRPACGGVTSGCPASPWSGGRRRRGVRLQPDLRPGHERGRGRGVAAGRVGGRGRPAGELFRSIARVVDGPWDIVVSGDLRLPGVRGRRTPKIKLINAYLERFHRAAEHDAELGRRFLRVANLIDPPSALLRPACLFRVFRGSGRGAAVTPAANTRERVAS
nr:hypothetical protein GCM10020093_049510 [Planobispora longispora]